MPVPPFRTSPARRWLAASLACALAAAAPAAPEQVDGDGGTSAFYRWDGPVGAPGRMLREEALTGSAALADAGSSRRILYSATSGVGRGAVAVSGALFLPKGAPPAGGWPLVAWAHGTTGFADVCAPSWRGQTPRDQAYLARWLAAGFAVVASDYEGLGTPGVHPYLLWRSEGRSVLDGVRAALASRPGTIANRVVVVGQSQGSGAAIGATLLAPGYAPGVHLLGTVATGLVVTFAGGASSKEAHYSDPRQMDGAFAMLRIGGIDRALHPELDAAAFVTDKGRRMLTAARTSCLRDMFALAEREGITGANSFARDLAPIDRDMEAAFTMPSAKLAVPIFVGTGLADAMAGTQQQYLAVEAMCRAGTKVTWRTYPGLTHGGAVNGSAPDSLPFVQGLLAGRPAPGNCAAVAPPGPVQPATPGIRFND